MPEQRFHTAVHPQWAHVLSQGWEPLGTTHEVEAIAETEDQGTPGVTIPGLT
jgi:hypothetical protein